MAITFVGYGTNGDGAGNPDYTITLPAMNQNDLVLVFHASGKHGLTLDTITSGYTNILSDTAGTSTQPGFLVAYKIMGASPDTTVTLPGSDGITGVAATAMAFRGVDTTAPVHNSFNVNGSGGPDPGALTPTINNCCIVIAAGCSVSDSAVGSVFNYLPSPTVQQNILNSFAITVASAYRILTGGASVAEDPEGWSSWSPAGPWQTLTIALTPVGAVGQPSGRRMGGVVGAQTMRGVNVRIW